jgi:TrmH family RNA methyltransferase
MITSRQNQRLKDIRRLRRSKGERGERALLEGPHLVAEAIAGGLEIETVLATPGFLATPEGERLSRALPFAPLEVSTEVFEDLTDADSPRGILAVALLHRSGAEALPLCEGLPYLYLDGLQDPGNLGALARVAEAAGAAGLALAPGSAHPNHPRALRASAGSLLRLPVAVETGPDALGRRLAPLQPRWAALATRGGESFWTASFPETLILAVGAEGPGLSPTLLARADLHLTIPIEMPVESLNATVAAALVLFEARRRRGLIPPP